MDNKYDSIAVEHAFQKVYFYNKVLTMYIESVETVSLFQKRKVLQKCDSYYRFEDIM